MIQRFIHDNRDADVAQLALQRKRYPELSDSDFRFCLQQIDGRQRTRAKLPTFATIDGWLYPLRLNLEQCSSERTARFKASLLSTLNTQHSTSLNTQHSTLNLIDCTGGYGVDTFFMSEVASETHYFEQNTDLAAIAEHNFRLAGKSIHCHPEPFTVESLQKLLTDNFQLSDLSQLSTASPIERTLNSQLILYLDPARRDNHGGKVFRLEDCTPNVIEIIHQIREQYIRLIRLIREQQNNSIRVLLKLSPMLDFHQAIAQLGGCWDVYVVSVNNEVKELLLLSAISEQPSAISSQISAIHAVALTDSGDHIFSFTPDEESSADVQYISPSSVSSADSALNEIVFEPDAALLKAGAFRLISARYGLKKAAPNTHLYFNSPLSTLNYQLIPGRCWQVLGVYTRVKDVQRALTRANVLTRNYVLSADALRGQLRLKDGGDDYVIGCRIADKPLLLHCRRILPLA